MFVMSKREKGLFISVSIFSFFLPGINWVGVNWSFVLLGQGFNRVSMCNVECHVY